MDTLRLAMVLQLIFCLLPTYQANSQTIFKISNLTNTFGLYYENIGLLKVSNDQWKLLIHTDLEEIREQFERINRLSSRIEELCRDLLEKDVPSNDCNNITPHVQQTLRTLRVQNELISNIIGSRTDLISKRGLINAVGTLAKQLFGTLDDNDAKYYDEQIQTLYENEEHIHKLIKEQTSVRESVITHLNETIDYIRNFDKKLNKMMLQINRFQNQTISNEDRLLHISAVNEVFAIFISVTDRFSLIQSHMVDILSFALQGMLHPYVISVPDMLKELIKIQTLLPSDANFPLQINSNNLNVFYKITNIHVYYSNKSLKFLLSIPLVKKLDFKVFKITSVPRQVRNKAYALIIPEKQLLIIDSVKQHYFLLDTDELTACKEISRSSYVCEQKSPIQISHINSACERSLFDPVTTLPKSCSSRIMFLTQPIYLQLAKPNTWIFITSTSERLIFQCKSESYETTIRGIGILSVQPGCETRSDTTILSSKSMFKSNVSSQYFFDIPNVNELESIKHLDIFENSKTYYNISTFEINNQITRLHQISLSLDELNNSIVPIKRIKNHSNYLISLTSIVIIIALIIVLWISYKLYKKISSKRTVSQFTVNQNESVVNIIEDSEKQKHVKQESNENHPHPNPRYNFRP